jgi:predicted lipoprotein with Yx(FWY)xxD motif
VYYVDDGENTLQLLHTPAATVKEAENASLSKSILTDAQGRALYALSGETEAHLLCTSQECLSTWAPLTVPTGASTARAAAGLHGKLGVLHRSGGVAQVTINGQPLYTYAGDHAVGEANGQGLKSFGGTWTTLAGTGQPAISSKASSSGSGTY